MGYVHSLIEMICLNSFIVLRGSGQTGVFARGGHPNPGFNHGFGGRGYQGHRGGGRSHDYRGRGYGARSWAHREGHGSQQGFGFQDRQHGSDGRPPMAQNNNQYGRGSGGSQTPAYHKPLPMVVKARVPPRR
jgi:hypothetical protein